MPDNQPLTVNTINPPKPGNDDNEISHLAALLVTDIDPCNYYHITTREYNYGLYRVAGLGIQQSRIRSGFNGKTWSNYPENHPGCQRLMADLRAKIAATTLKNVAITKEEITNNLKEIEDVSKQRITVVRGREMFDKEECINAPAAIRANETLARLWGHLQPDTTTINISQQISQLQASLGGTSEI
jgi:hypothetical protein